jgi:hypothetical protein
LVKGVQMTLKPIALSIRPGGALEELHVGCAIRTSGEDVVSVELSDRVGRWDVRRATMAKGMGSDGVHTPGRALRPARCHGLFRAGQGRRGDSPLVVAEHRVDAPSGFTAQNEKQVSDQKPASDLLVQSVGLTGFEPATP